MKTVTAVLLLVMLAVLVSCAKQPHTSAYLSKDPISLTVMPQTSKLVIGQPVVMYFTISNEAGEELNRCIGRGYCWFFNNAETRKQKRSMGYVDGGAPNSCEERFVLSPHGSFSWQRSMIVDYVEPGEYDLSVSVDIIDPRECGDPCCNCPSKQLFAEDIQVTVRDGIAP